MSAAKSSSAPVASEQILSAKTDLAVSNAIVKTGLGLAGGIVASAILFRRRPWPVLVGLGFGAGQGYSDAERVFNPAAIPGFKIASDGSSKPSSPYAQFNPLVSQVKEKAQEVKAKVVGKAESVKSEVKADAKVAEAKVEKKVDEIKDGKKWV